MAAVYLNKLIYKFSTENLREGGHLVMKIIMGPAEESLKKMVRCGFEDVQRVKPSASR